MSNQDDYGDRSRAREKQKGGSGEYRLYEILNPLLLGFVSRMNRVDSLYIVEGSTTDIRVQASRLLYDQTSQAAGGLEDP